MITEQQLSELSKIHGNILPLEVRKTVFVFRPPTKADVDLALCERETEPLDWIEILVIAAVLVPSMPSANLSADQKHSEVEEEALTSERERLRALWTKTPIVNDQVLLSCGAYDGLNATTATAREGDSLVITCSSAPASPEVWTETLRAKPLALATHRKIRKAMALGEVDKERKIWNASVTDDGGALSRRPLLFVSITDELYRGGETSYGAKKLVIQPQEG
jgi:hypothetical protein